MYDGGKIMELPKQPETSAPQSAPDQAANQVEDEGRRLRRLQILMNMVMSVISQDPAMTVEEAAAMVANTRRAALALFPGKELAFDLIYKPRLERVMRERFHLQ
jgi:hypothetical protein